MKSLMMKSMGLYLNSLALIMPRKAARIGFNLFCSPFRTPVNIKHKQFLDTAEQSDFEYNGIQIRTYKWGSGENKILFLHGWQSHTYRWKNYIDSLNDKGYTLYAFDAPGHGLSGGKYLNVKIYSEVIETFLTKVAGVETIICHSVGSFSAIYALHRNPVLPAGRLVTLASPGEASDFFDFYQHTLGLSDKAIALITDYFNLTIGITLNDFSAPAFASSLKIPGLIIHDEDDPETSVDNSRRIHNAWDGSRFVVTKGFGHNLKSGEVLKEVVSFIQQ